MPDDRHPVPDAEIAAAIGAIPETLDRDVRLAGNGRAHGIETISSMLLDYVAARTVAVDPDGGTPETWLALETAAGLAADHVAARVREPGLSVPDWTHAVHLALVCRSAALKERLADLAAHLPERSQTVEVRALLATMAKVPLPKDAPVLLSGWSEFGPALKAELAEHRERSTTVRDLVAWRLLAMAAVAHDAGLRHRVTSPYLPARLATGSGPAPATPSEPIPRPPANAG